MTFTEEDREKFDAALSCWLCGDEFGMKKNERKVRDHCHYTGKYRRAVHSICNLIFKKPPNSPPCFSTTLQIMTHIFLFKILEKKMDSSLAFQTMKKNIFPSPLKLN